MARSRKQSFIPSMGVLVAAIGCAVVAAILVNLYIGSLEAKYARTVKRVLQFAKDVNAGDQIVESDLKVLPVYERYKEAFAQAVEADTVQSILGKRAPRKFNEGEVLMGGEWSQQNQEAVNYRVKPGHELIDVPVMKDLSPGLQLQVGDFVTVYGSFDVNPDPKVENIRPFPIFESVKVGTIDGRTKAPEGRRAGSLDKIGIEITSGQVAQLLEIKEKMVDKRFTITLTARPEVAAREPEINPAVLRLIQGRSTGPEWPLD